jgi:hypothetical protein
LVVSAAARSVISTLRAGCHFYLAPTQGFAALASAFNLRSTFVEHQIEDHHFRVGFEVRKKEALRRAA